MRLPEWQRLAWSRRLPLLAEVLGHDAPDTAPATAKALASVLGDLVATGDRSQVWLALAVLSGTLPDETTVLEVSRSGEFDSGLALAAAVTEATTRASARWTVRVARDEVLVDVAHTVGTHLATGIQRVTREVARRWMGDRGCVPVAWTDGFRSLRALTDDELTRVREARPNPDPGAPQPADATVVVPWTGATYVVPELAAEPERTSRLLALARFAPVRTSVLGHDCIPVTSAETTAIGLGAVFARNLATLRYFDRLATTSRASTAEYEGWRRTLAAIGLDGPRIREVPLPVEAPQADADAEKQARARFTLSTLPLVLVVGSHEPRKNHLAVLHAAELLWREGLQFTLSFVGGNSWGSEEFQERIHDLQRAGRPVGSETGVPDDLLWAAYRLARMTVFPSLNEGFGLPVAESLAAGTPVITSRFGSMAELAEGGGALTVDPRDDHDLRDAMRALLTDDALHLRLREEAAARPPRTWDTYAAELAAFLLDPLPDGD